MASRAVLKDRDHLGARGVETPPPRAAHPDQVLAAERAAEVAHEHHHERATAPALTQLDTAVDAVQPEVREFVARREHGITFGFPLMCSRRDARSMSAMRLTIPFLATFAAVLLVPAAAQAGTLSYDGDTLYFQAAGGERNSPFFEQTTTAGSRSWRRA